MAKTTEEIINDFTYGMNNNPHFTPEEKKYQISEFSRIKRNVEQIKKDFKKVDLMLEELTNCC